MRTSPGEASVVGGGSPGPPSGRAALRGARGAASAGRRLQPAAGPELGSARILPGLELRCGQGDPGAPGRRRGALPA